MDVLEEYQLVIGAVGIVFALLQVRHIHPPSAESDQTKHWLCSNRGKHRLVCVCVRVSVPVCVCVPLSGGSMFRLVSRQVLRTTASGLLAEGSQVSHWRKVPTFPSKLLAEGSKWTTGREFLAECRPQDSCEITPTPYWHYNYRGN